MSARNELILNPLTGRYVKKYSSNWLRLVAQGTIVGDPKIEAPVDSKVTEPVQTRNDRGVINDLVNLAEEKKDALKGLSRTEIDDLLSKALYERLMMRGKAPSSAALPKSDAARPVGRPKGIAARPVPISRSAAAPITTAMRSKKAMMDAQAYGSDSDSGDDEHSISSADIETTDVTETD